MNILSKIIARKHYEVIQNKTNVSIKELEEIISKKTLPRSLTNIIRNQKNEVNIIAEFKKKSPSKGFINENANITKIAVGYERAGAVGMSVLTDEMFFNGNKNDLIDAKNACNLPILRKDFVISEYQLLEARAWGADVVLLIAAVLSPNEVKRLAEFARSLNLEVLLELHNKEELDHVCNAVNLVGINNRNLNSFEVSIEHSVALLPELSNDFVCISESGLDDAKVVATLHKAGFEGFLMGEYFMKQTDPAKTCSTFIQTVNSLL